jgi:hypothetical protein
MNKKKTDIQWLDEPAAKDYDAAQKFLELLYEPKKARSLVKKLKRAEMSAYAAKDILRASGTVLSDIQAFDWTKQQGEIRSGEPLSPILLVRGEDGSRLIVADGFHRMCAVFSTDEHVIVPCKIV